MSKYAVMPMTDYEGICNAVRAKTGGTAKLKSSEVIEGIQTGSTPVVQSLTVTENGTYAAPSGVDGYNPVTVNVAGSGSGIDALIDGSITEIESNAKIVLENTFCGRSELKSAKFKAATLIDYYAFKKCDKLETFELQVQAGIGDYAFQYCSKLRRVILRSETLCVLSNANAFQGCYQILGGSSTIPTDGYVYVPSALVDSYKSATNWAYLANQFRALEDYTVDGTITGELDPTKI